nr:hypothetical protein [Deltaproteobacteria bacterium]
GKIRVKAEIRAGVRAGKIGAPLEDGTIETACQQACPTEAIIFGDLADKNSRISRLHDDRRSYALLPELYTKPRNRFLAKVRNPNPKLMPAVTAPAVHQGTHPGPGDRVVPGNPTNPTNPGGTAPAGGH